MNQPFTIYWNWDLCYANYLETYVMQIILRPMLCKLSWKELKEHAC